LQIFELVKLGNKQLLLALEEVKFIAPLCIANNNRSVEENDFAVVANF
jgi:hypothetical protein